MKRFKIAGLLALIYLLSNYDHLQSDTINSTHLTKTLKFHHFNLTDFSFIHSSDWHYSLHKTNNNIYKVLKNPLPVNFHFVTGDLVDSKSKDGTTSHQYEFEENQVNHILSTFHDKYKLQYPDFKGFFTVLGNHDIYDTLEHQKERQHHIIDTNLVKIVMIDSGPFGLGRPLNFFGFIDDLVLDIIEMSLDNKPIIIMAHYPLSTTFYSKKLLKTLRNYKYPVYYLCGHLHYLKEPFGHYLQTTYNGIVELEVGDVKEHSASRLFHVTEKGVSFVNLNNINYTNAIITWPLDSKFMVNDPPKWDNCIHLVNYDAHTLHIYINNELVHSILNAENKKYFSCNKSYEIAEYVKVHAIGNNVHNHTVYIHTVKPSSLDWKERAMNYLFSLNYADSFIPTFYLYYILQFMLLASLLYSKGKHGPNWMGLSSMKYTYSKVWIVFLITSLSFLFMPMFYGSFAKDNNRCSVFEAPFYPFGTQYNGETVFQFDFLIWANLFLYYENFVIFMGYHIHINRNNIKNKWVVMIYPALIIYMKYRLLWNMFIWYVYEDANCFQTRWLYYMWNSFGFMQLTLMPVSWIFLRYLHLMTTNKLSLGFRPKDL
eukprot:NODE_38_length_30618_cov_0.377142.p2 type:complete len:598 gc:universal NODE_38_length_30618_cov_0.377142:14356-16149(+)